MIPSLLTRRDVMEQLQLSESAVERLLTSGELESVRIGRSRRVPADALVAFVDRLRAVAEPPAA